ncbi:hypothetical protein [Polaribacter staleyi]|uniref:hypothetical protein n=1 Tax=Polaribacter staleyi TaxID=2022337 RepID=UPI0031BA8F38
MKIKFYFIAVIAMIFSFSNCENDEDTISSIVQITVNDVSGNSISNETVYMFSQPTTETFGSNPIHAKQSSVTDESGIATFELQEVIDLDPINSQSTLYFTVLEKTSSTNYSVKGTIGVTIKKGDNYKKTLTLNK